MTASKFSGGTIIISFFVLISSCTKIPSASCYWESNSKDDQTLRVSGFDESSGIRYVISNDRSNLFFTFTTLNPGIEKSILKNGVILYVNTGKKEDKSVYLKFPLPSGFEQSINKNNSQNGTANSVVATDKRLFNEAMWVKNDNVKFVKTNGAGEGFLGQFEVDADGSSNYRVSIPLTQIDPGGFKNINNLTIGLEIENVSQGNDHHGASGYQGGHGGSRGGYGGRGGMHGGSSMANKPSNYYRPQAVKIWFTTKPAKS